MAMDENFLHLALLLAYGPFFLMLLLFIIGLVLRWSGNADFLQWLIHSTAAQQPVKRSGTEKPKT
jgi:hypothetical protein